MTEQTSSRAVMALICGILAWTGCPVVGGILAVVLGAGEKSGIGRAGAILGWIHLALVGISLLVALVLIVVALAAGNW